MGKIFIMNWDGKLPKKESAHVNLKDKKYLGFAHWLLTYEDGSQEIMYDGDPIGKLFYKAMDWDKDGKPILTE